MSRSNQLDYASLRAPLPAQQPAQNLDYDSLRAPDPNADNRFSLSPATDALLAGLGKGVQDLTNLGYSAINTLGNVINPYGAHPLHLGSNIDFDKVFGLSKQQAQSPLIDIVEGTGRSIPSFIPGEQAATIAGLGEKLGGLIPTVAGGATQGAAEATPRS